MSQYNLLNRVEYVASDAFSLISVCMQRVLVSILNSQSPGQSSIDTLIPVDTDTKLGSVLPTELDIDVVLISLRLRNFNPTGCLNVKCAK